MATDSLSFLFPKRIIIFWVVALVCFFFFLSCDLCILNLICLKYSDCFSWQWTPSSVQGNSWNSLVLVGYLMPGLPYRHLVYSSARKLDSLYADLGNPSVVLQSCISLYFLTAVVTSLSSDISANVFAVFFLNFNHPLAPTHKEKKRSSLSALLPSVLSPPVSACVWLLSSVFR